MKNTRHRGLGNLRLVNSWDEQNRMLDDFITSYFPAGHRMRVLEAGCGSGWPIDLSDREFSLTAVDTDESALALRRETDKDLDRAILGDLRQVDFPAESFDLIYSSYVLEHIDGAESVVARFFRWVEPGGLVVLKIPDRDSVYGFVARTTPFWCHVAFHKYILRMPDAGKPGHDPYPTHYDAIVSRAGIHEYCARNGFEIEVEFGSNHYLPKLGRLAPLVHAATKVVEVSSLSRLAADHNNLAYVIRKPR